MNIILNIRNLNAGGAERVAVLVARGLQTLGNSVTLAVCQVSAMEERRYSDLIIVNLHAKKPLRQGHALARLVMKIQPDAVIAFGINVGIGAALSQRIWWRRVPLVLRNENNLPQEWAGASLFNRHIGPALSRWAARHAHVVAVSQSLTHPTADYLRLPTKRVSTILNPVLGDTFPVESGSRSALHPWLRDSECPVFVAMGRLEHQKGFDVLINAFARVRQEGQARLVIFGQGSLQAALQAQIDALEMQEMVTLAGHTDHAMAQMQAAHAFVLSSRFEGFGLVLVEALHAGAQVIATRCDYGPAEILEDGRYGTLVPVDDPAALSAAMRDSLDGRIALPRPPEAWFERFTATAAARQHIALIKSLRGR